MIERNASLDQRRSSESQSTIRQELLTRELRRAMYRYIKHLPESMRAVNEVRHKNGDGVARAFADRIVETTYHPSQNLPPELYLALVEEIKIIWKAHKEAVATWDDVMIEHMASTSAQKIMQTAGEKIMNLADAAIQSNADLDADKIQIIQQAIVTGFNEPIDAAADQTMAAASMIEQQLSIIEPIDRFDESQETVLEAKLVLFNGIAEHHHVWVDFDGAKRAEGHTYSKYAALLYEDIMHSFTVLDETERQIAVQTFKEFRQIAALNHAVASLLKTAEKLSASTAARCEQMLDVLKKRRYEKLNDLIRLRNEVQVKNDEAGQNEIIYLSDRVKFLPRLDHKTIQAGIDAQYNRVRRAYQLEKKVDSSQYAMLHNILNQVLEINQLTQERRRWGNDELINDGQRRDTQQSIVPQIMVAMSEGAEDIIALQIELDHLRSQKAKVGMGEFHYATEVATVPLFEGEDTVAPEKIKQYLETMWQYYFGKYGADHGREKFQQNINEIFIAGSDLSKEVGQTSALVKMGDAYEAIQVFNTAHATDVRLKLGTGEAPFRQGGLWDPEGYLPMVRGKIVQYEDLAETTAQKKYGAQWEAQLHQERSVVEQKQAFLQDTFGADWAKKLVRQPRGFNRLLEALPMVNSFTQQTRAKELTIWNIDTDRLRQMKRAAEEQQAQNTKEVHAGNYRRIPLELKVAAQAEQQVYQTLFGKKGQAKMKFGCLLQFCAKTLPAPVLRDRPLGREGADTDPVKFFQKLAEPFIDARAIGANSVSNMLFPLYLIGKGSLLESAQQQGELSKVFEHKLIDAKELLREMKLYEQIAADIFTMLRTHDMIEDATLLAGEWQKLCALRPHIQEEMWRQESPPGVDFMQLTVEQKQQLAECFVPGMRELLDDQFVSDRSQLLQQSFQQYQDIIATAMANIQAGYDLTNSIESAVQQGLYTSPQQAWQSLKAGDIPAELSTIYSRYQTAVVAQKNITPQRYGTFIGDVAYCYSPGM